MRRALLLSLFAFLSLAADARACTCVRSEDVLARAQGVFVGTVTERVKVPGEGRPGFEIVDYTFDVEQVVRGEFPRRVKYRSNTSSAACGMNLKVGHRTGVMISRPGEAVGICNLIDPELVGVPAPPPSSLPSLLGALLGTCWALIF